MPSKATPAPASAAMRGVSAEQVDFAGHGNGRATQTTQDPQKQITSGWGRTLKSHEGPMRSILVVFMSAAIITQANAQSSGVTGKILFDLCSSGGNNAAYFSCVMYIEGFLDGYSAREAKICFPENLTTSEAAATFVRIWRSTETRKGATNIGRVAQAPSAYAFTSMMTVAYPCKP